MSKKIKKDEYGVKLKYPERSCKQCGKYPCFPEIDKCASDFAVYGCTIWSKKIKEDDVTN